MTRDPQSPSRFRQRLLFAGLLAVVLGLEMLFLANVIRWRGAPDVGWIPMPEFGPRAIGFVSAVGEEAGLRRGDRIVSVNGRSYATQDELNALLNFEIGGKTVYELGRAGETLTLTVTTRELGWRRALLQSGLIWILGMTYVGIGILVFLMKPLDRSSWTFLVVTALGGLFITFMSPSYFYTPRWLDNVILLVLPFLPAALLHLAAVFPQRRRFFLERRVWLLAPLALSLALALVIRSLASRIPNVPPWLLQVTYFYLLASLLIFLASTLESWRRSTSLAVRLQSLVVLTGIVLALIVPMAELLSNLLFNVSFFPHQILAYLFFMLFFPASVGYAIARHDLFEISTVVRRTYGYLLSTAAIVVTYVALVTVLNATLGSVASESPLFSIAFALGAVFALEPVHRRSQRFVDRAFYRQRYDYRRTIRDVSEAMTAILDPESVRRTLVRTVVGEMFLENGTLLLPDGTPSGFDVNLVEGREWPRDPGRHLDLDGALVEALRGTKAGVFRHEVDLHPAHAARREVLQRSFDLLEAELLLPMLYEEKLGGVLSLGRKKSGKMFSMEDVDLLRTLINQSVIALENARLFDDLAASLKRVQILESIETHLAKFVPKTVLDLIEESPDAPLLDKREVDVSVLFADMTGYTLLSSQLPLGEVNAIVERYFGAFLDEILKRGGDVNETAGDGLMVLFRDEDPIRHARAAAEASLGIQRRTREINAEREGTTPIRMHVGVSSGIASVGATKIEGSGGTRWTYTASGPTTNLAARLSALGEEIVVSEETRSRLGDRHEVEDLGFQRLKNVGEPVRVYRVRG